MMTCGCEACQGGVKHYNDCAVHNDPALPVAPCNCERGRIAELEVALFDLVNMERTATPDMNGKRRTFACMRNGTVLADCLDRARALLPYDMQATDPHHGGKISK